ncbi:MAG: hypothetical protein HY795_11870 [Desulfovibrio sp.]|nr:hypothetical protein [Desulfovibrio sp.]MBI4958109.1 hypothetical protein [Desulfovibrio sp.]
MATPSTLSQARAARIAAVTAVLAWALLSSAQAPACTLWSASGDSAGGGTILAKNRDFSPDSQGRLVLVRPEQGFAYLGFYALVKERERLVAGVNETGLAMVGATAGSLPRAERDVPSRVKSLMAKILANSKDVDEALAHMDWFAGHAPVMYMLSDAAKTAWVEVGAGGKVAWRETAQGTLAHTNHYISPELGPMNMKVGPSSQARLERIQELLAGQKKFTIEDFEKFGNDRSDGPDNSIFRTGSTPKSSRTMARFLVRTRSGQPTQTWVSDYDDPDKPWSFRRDLDREFWEQIPRGSMKTLAPTPPADSAKP